MKTKLILIALICSGCVSTRRYEREVGMLVKTQHEFVLLMKEFMQDSVMAIKENRERIADLEKWKEGVSTKAVSGVVPYLVEELPNGTKKTYMHNWIK